MSYNYSTLIILALFLKILGHEIQISQGMNLPRLPVLMPALNREDTVDLLFVCLFFHVRMPHASILSRTFNKIRRRNYMGSNKK